MVFALNPLMVLLLFGGLAAQFIGGIIFFVKEDWGKHIIGKIFVWWFWLVAIASFLKFVYELGKVIINA